MVFSHGLGGSRNAYSHICGSLASHGIIVVASDHRDQSAPVSYIRATSKTPARILDYKRYSHTPSPEVYEGRDEQLKIRLWELGLIHDAILKIDCGQAPENLDPNSVTWRKNDTNNVLAMFGASMDVHRPGSIIWAGHSFGACMIVQLLKSTFWGPAKGEKAVNNPLFSPEADSSLSKQITPKSPAILLDMWCLPLQSPQTKELWEKPMPCYAPGGPGGRGVLAILSEAFYKWTGNMSATTMALTSNVPGDSRPAPRFFYPTTSAHLSQSDFGILFGWLIKRVLKTEQPPERYIKLNTRAILEVLRENNYEVAGTSATDQEEELQPGKELLVTGAKHTGDWKILDINSDIPGWNAINVDRPSSTSGSPVRNRSPSASSAVETEVMGEVVA
jgi:platelet-activating factor acetylhydrolase